MSRSVSVPGVSYSTAGKRTGPAELTMMPTGAQTYVWVEIGKRTVRFVVDTAALKHAVAQLGQPT